MSAQLDRAVEREEQSLEGQLNDGSLSMREYNESLRDLYRSAREEEYTENRQGCYNGQYGRNEGW